MRHVQRLKSRLLGRTPSHSPQASSQLPEALADASSTTAENASEEPQRDKHGLFELSPEDPSKALSMPDKYCVDVIAIHGLNGDAFSTWRHQPDGTLWLRDLLPHSLPGCHVYTYGYPSKIFSESTARLQECARDLIVSVRQLRDATVREKRPLIFVCHSLGGLLFKQALIIAHEDHELYEDVLASTTGVIFLGTPHKGSAAADLAKVAATIINTFVATTSIGWKPRTARTDLLHHLLPDSQALQDLSLSARNRLSKVSVVSCFETEPTPPLNTVIVDRASATLSIPHEEIIPMYENHKTICRFPGQTHSYKKVARALRIMASKASIERPATEKSSTHSSSLVLTDLERTCISLLNENDLSRHAEMPPSPVSGTCQWIHKHRRFVSWLETTSNALLWLTGRPGSGKTILSWSLFKHIKDWQLRSKNAVIFMCQNINTQTNSKTVIIGLILQVIDRHRSLIRHVRAVFERHGPSMVQSFSLLWHTFLGLIKDPKVGVLYIILDSLDECEQSSCRQLLKAIFDLLADPLLSTHEGNRVKFLITSRPLLHESCIDTREVRRCRISIDEDNTGYAKDLELFIRERVTSICAKRQFPSEIRDYLYETVQTRADRTFLWIQLVLGSVENSLLTSRKDLHKILNTIPDDLVATYHRYLAGIPFTHRDDAVKLLQLLLASSRPLSLEEMNIAFTLGDSDMTIADIQRDAQHAIAHTVQSILGPLVRLSKQQDSEKTCISLVHLSLKDFFLDGTTSKNNSFPAIREVTSRSSALRMATVCIQYLLLEDFDTDFFNVEESPANSSLQFPDFTDEPLIDGSQCDSSDESDSYLHPDILFQEKDAMIPSICSLLCSKYIFYEYASIHWTEHYALCEDISPDSLRSGAMTLLDVSTAACRNWLQLYRHVAVSPIDDNGLDQNIVVLASRFNLAAAVHHLLQSQEPSKAVKDRSLYWAARLGHDRIIVPLLRVGADPNARAFDQQTPVTIAAEQGHLASLVELLAAKSTDVNTPGRQNRSALSFACGGGHVDIVETLLSRNDCRTDNADISGATPFFWAVGGEHDSVIRMLRKRSKIDINHQDKTGRTAVSWAAGDGTPQTLATLLTFKGVDINIRDQTGRSALSWASGNGCVDTVMLLLRNKMIDKASADHDERGAISWACASGHADVLICLLKHGCPGADTQDIDGWTPLAWAIQRDSPATVGALIRSGRVELDRQDRNGRTALSWAVEYGHSRVVEALLQAGADPGVASDAGSTPVTIARSYGRDDLVALLVAANI